MQARKFWRDASGRLTYDVPHVEPADYPGVCSAVADVFRLTPVGSLVIGNDQMFWDFRRAEQVVGLDWDIWMGLIVVAKTEKAEPLVGEIAAWLRSSWWTGADEPASCHYLSFPTLGGRSMTDGRFHKFLTAFPPLRQCPVDADALGEDVRTTFEIVVPRELLAFWSEVGCGSFADGELYFFGREADAERESLLDWNRHAFWRDVWPPPANGGPVFFAETCFGDQLGFRYRGDGTCVPVLFALATIELFLMAPEFGKLFSEVLTEREAVADPEHLAAAREGVGALPPGHWYCPIVSPLVGGSAKPHNFMAMTPKAFAVATIAEWKALGPSQDA